MKKIKCEMCGGTDFVKEDGLYVCQTCGIKYTPEEAKKSMVEITINQNITKNVNINKNVNLSGKVDISGSNVRVEHVKDDDKIRQMIDSALSINDYKTACKHYATLEYNNPTDPIIHLYSVINNAYNCDRSDTDRQYTYIEFALDPALEQYKKNNSPKITSELMDLRSMLRNVSVDLQTKGMAEYNATVPAGSRSLEKLELYTHEGKKTFVDYFDEKCLTLFDDNKPLLAKLGIIDAATGRKTEDINMDKKKAANKATAVAMIISVALSALVMILMAANQIQGFFFAGFGVFIVLTCITLPIFMKVFKPKQPKDNTAVNPSPAIKSEKKISEMTKEERREQIKLRSERIPQQMDGQSHQDNNINK